MFMRMGQDGRPSQELRYWEKRPPPPPQEGVCTHRQGLFGGQWGRETPLPDPPQLWGAGLGGPV